MIAQTPDLIMLEGNQAKAQQHNGKLKGRHAQIVVEIDSTLELLQQMAAAAEIGSERMFLEAKQKIEWQSRPAEDFLRAVRWAFSAGAHLAARNLSKQGADLYPENADLQKLAYLLAPPKVIKRAYSPDPTIKMNRDWIRSQGCDYRGQWVALRNGELLASGESLDVVTQQTGVARDILFTKVY